MKFIIKHFQWPEDFVPDISINTEIKITKIYYLNFKGIR
jgi:hypothetical protein